MRHRDGEAGSPRRWIPPLLRGRTGRYLVLGTVVVWALLVLINAFPEIAKLVLHPLGLAGDSLRPPFGRVSGIREIELDGIARPAWLVLRAGALLWGALVLGRQVLHVSRLTVNDRRGEALVGVAVGFGVVSYIVFALALAGAMHPGALTALTIALVVNAALWTAFRILHGRAGHEGRERRRGPIAVARLAAGGRVWPAAVFLAGLFLVTALIGALALERGFDALLYHLELPRSYLETGGFVDLPGDRGASHPQAIELVYSVAMSWGGAAGAKLLHFLFGALTVLATYGLARRLTGRRWAAVAAVILISAPTVHWGFTTAGVELAAAFLVTLALTELLAWLDERSHRRLIRCGLLLGLALATMHAALLFLPMMVVLALAAAAGGFAGGKRAPGQPGPAVRARGAWAAVIAFPLAALLVAAPWYVRNTLGAENPGFPDVYGLPGVHVDGLGLGRDPLTLVRLPWDLTASSESFHGNFGPVFLLTIPLLLLARRSPPGHALALGLCALGFFAFWSAPASSFQARLLVPVVPALSVLGAVGLACLSAWLRDARLRRLAVLVPWTVLLLAVFSLPPFVPWHRSFAVSNTLREVDLEAAFGGGETEPSILELVDGSPVFLGPAGDEPEVYEALRAAGYTHLVVDKDRRSDLPPRIAVLTGQFVGQYLERLFDDDRAELFAVRTPGNVVERLPRGFEELVVLQALDQPTAVDFAVDGRIFVAEKSGLIKVFDDPSDRTPTTFADLRTNVNDYHERGLLGLALDPGFPAEPYVYALYTHDAAIGGTAPLWGSPGVSPDVCPDPPGANRDGCVVSGRLSRLTAGGDVMTGPERVLIEDWCQQYPSHSVGDLVFGSDGALYASGGEGASYQRPDYGEAGDPPNPCGDPPAGRGGAQRPPAAEGGSLRAQDLRSSADPSGLNGTIIRIDPGSGAALPDNPLHADADPNAGRTIAYGLRNPYRFTLRPGGDELWIADVGQIGWDEIDRIEDPFGSVANFGWPCYEGPERMAEFDALDIDVCELLYSDDGAVEPPFFAVAAAEPVVDGDGCPTDRGTVISGIAFSDEQRYPGDYAGALFFGDYARDCVWVMPIGSSGDPDPSAVRAFLALAANPVDLTVGPGGDLYYVDFDGGTVRRIAYTGRS